MTTARILSEEEVAREIIGQLPIDAARDAWVLPDGRRLSRLNASAMGPDEILELIGDLTRDKGVKAQDPGGSPGDAPTAPAGFFGEKPLPVGEGSDIGVLLAVLWTIDRWGGFSVLQRLVAMVRGAHPQPEIVDTICHRSAGGKPMQEWARLEALHRSIGSRKGDGQSTAVAAVCATLMICQFMSSRTVNAGQMRTFCRHVAEAAGLGDGWGPGLTRAVERMDLPVTIPDQSSIEAAHPLYQVAWDRVADGRVRITVEELLQAHERASLLGMKWGHSVQRAIAERGSIEVLAETLGWSQPERWVAPFSLEQNLRLFGASEPSPFPGTSPVVLISSEDGRTRIRHPLPLKWRTFEPSTGYLIAFGVVPRVGG